MTARRLIIALLLGCCGRIAAADGERVAVIVNPGRAETVSVTEVSQIYLKKRKYWSDGAQIVPLNREAASSIRQEFSRLVYGEGAQHLATYWNEQYFHGIFPPATLSSDAAVKQYVARDRDAIGYIAADSIDDSVRAVLNLGAREPTAATLPPDAEPLPAEVGDSESDAP